MALADVARKIEESLNRRGIVKYRNAGWVPAVTPYAGYGSVHAAKVLARATMVPPEARRRHRSPFPFLPKYTHAFAATAAKEIIGFAAEKAAQAERGWRQFFTTQVGFLPVTVTLGGVTISTRTDRSGYIDLLIENHGLEPGWHEATITPVVGEPVKAPVVIVSPTTTQGLISDIDDTVVITWLPRSTLAAYNSFVLHTNARKPVPGMATFYNEVLKGKPNAPVFYLSTGAWNTYPTLTTFTQANGFPVGPMLMTDWGPTPNAVFRSGSEHKIRQLRNLLIMFPEIRWVLVGDDGQHDPLIYDELAREHPSHIAAIAIRELNPVEQVLSHGTLEAAHGNRTDMDIVKSGVPVIRGRDGFKLLEEWRRVFPQE